MADNSRESTSERDCSVESDGWVFYRDRPEWKDVTPIPQDDGPPVVRIAYSERFQDVFDYFRAVLKSEEKSPRVLVLTEDALDLNPANYTVWFYRRTVLKHLGSDISNELKYCQEMIVEHPKNYQVWEHRRVLIEWLNDPGDELKFIEMILESDQKNYHAWQHRQWILTTFKQWDNELAFIDKLLDDDIRNNSAWSHRYFVVSRTQKLDSPDDRDKEISYTLGMIKLVQRNESSWNYLRGMMDHCDETDAEVQRCRVKKFCEELLSIAERSGDDKDPYGRPSPGLLGFMVELLQKELASNADAGAREQLLSTAQNYCKMLAYDTDKVRQRYWDFISDNLAAKFAVAS